MKVPIVDDDTLVAQSLSTILSAENDVEVIGLGCSGSEAAERYRELTPDILLMDIQMLGGDGLSTARRILAEDAGARIVFLTIFFDNEYTVWALKMGACGHLIKQDVIQVVPALRSVTAGVCVLEGEMLERSTTMELGRPAGGREQAEEGPGASAKDLRSTVFAVLIDREYEVVEAATEGLGNAEVAARLFMSEGTVCNRTGAILTKLGLRNRVQVAVMYYRCAQARWS